MKYRLEKGVVSKTKPIDPKKRIQFFSSFEEQELAEIDENLAKPVAVRFAEAVVGFAESTRPSRRASRGS